MLEINLTRFSQQKVVFLDRLFFIGISNFVESSFKSSFELLEILLDEIFL